ncbi:MAG: arginine deiminase family protein [Candidatus Delongbacteria bacterium]|nr:arginine deiminase family protein [Candidatus Delongbacteria bacterium]
MRAETFKIRLNSEIGKLNGVILHTPGAEVQNMTPENAERALYSDILNLKVAQDEYNQLSGFLSKVTHTYQVKTLLEDLLENSRLRENLLDRICDNENAMHHRHVLDKLDHKSLAAQIIEGVIMTKNTLSAYLSKDRYALKPLHNFFFTRDAAITINDKVLIARMANKVRERESIIMQSVFDFHPLFSANTVNPVEDKYFDEQNTIEGGDVLVARKDVLLIGNSSRTTSQGIDYLLHRLRERKENMHIIVQELPYSPESFIHLDMVFTFLDKDKCMVYEPLILKPSRFQTVHIVAEGGKVKIFEEENLLSALKKLGMDLEPVLCGGTTDQWIQQREQWHSGANFFAFEPGKVVGYERNSYTIDELNNHGFEVLRAKDVIKGKAHPDDYKKCVVTIGGSELSRGGGGARCMTMPFNRDDIG